MTLERGGCHPSVEVLAGVVRRLGSQRRRRPRAGGERQRRLGRHRYACALTAAAVWRPRLPGCLGEGCSRASARARVDELPVDVGRKHDDDPAGRVAHRRSGLGTASGSPHASSANSSAHDRHLLPRRAAAAPASIGVGHGQLLRLGTVRHMAPELRADGGRIAGPRAPRACPSRVYRRVATGLAASAVGYNVFACRPASHRRSLGGRHLTPVHRAFHRDHVQAPPSCPGSPVSRGRGRWRSRSAQQA